MRLIIMILKKTFVEHDVDNDRLEFFNENEKIKIKK